MQKRLLLLFIISLFSSCHPTNNSVNEKLTNNKTASNNDSVKEKIALPPPSNFDLGDFPRNWIYLTYNDSLKDYTIFDHWDFANGMIEIIPLTKSPYFNFIKEQFSSTVLAYQYTIAIYEGAQDDVMPFLIKDYRQIDSSSYEFDLIDCYLGNSKNIKIQKFSISWIDKKRGLIKGIFKDSFNESECYPNPCFFVEEKDTNLFKVVHIPFTE